MRVEMFLSQDTMASSELMTAHISGFDVRTTMLDAGLPVPAEAAKAAEAVIVEVKCGQNSSMERLHRLIGEHGGLPVIAAVREPSLDEVRVLMRGGVADVVPLPLKRSELEAALGRIRTDIEKRQDKSRPDGRIVSVAKSRGGAGATTLVTQIARAMAREAGDSEICLVDLDIQFGNAALYLGELPKIGVKDLLDAGSRADSALLRTTTGRHASGLSYLAAPQDIVPLDSITADQVLAVLDLLTREFATVFVDLPSDWTDWSLSALARSDLILFVSELDIANLHQARKQIDLIRQQDLGEIPFHVVMNKVEKKLFRSVDFEDAVRILGRDVSWSVAEDKETVKAALDQGVGLEEISPRSRATRDIQKMAAELAETVKTDAVKAVS